MNSLIIVGVDGTPTAARAARRAAELAKATGSALHVVSAYTAEAPRSLRDGESGPSEADVAQDIAERTAGELAPLVGMVTSAAVRGNPADALVAEAQRIDASVIVVGNRRVQGIARVLGSVAAGVAHHAHCDVYIVHTH